MHDIFALSYANFQQCRERLKNVLKETKLIYSPIFSNESGNHVYIKPENLQTTGSFKIRGAYNKIFKLSEKEKENGLIASSAGNHAQGVAYAARELGAKVTIIMPKITPLIKVEATKNYGANVILHGDVYDEAYEEARRLGKKEGYVFIHPFDDIDVIEGQGTIGLEIIEELKDVDCILVPIGGGGMISGIALAAKMIKPDIEVIGVEPEGAQSMKISIARQQRTALESLETIAEGAAVREPGELTFSISKKYVNDIITVSDFDMMESFLLLLEKHKLIGESAGVLSLAGVKKIAQKNKNIVCIISGGNIDVLTIASLIERGLVARGRTFCFTVDLPDKPGQILKISHILANQNANIIQLIHNPYKTFKRLMEVQLEVTLETNGHQHVEQIISALKEAGYSITRVC